MPSSLDLPRSAVLGVLLIVAALVRIVLLLWLFFLVAFLSSFFLRAPRSLLGLGSGPFVVVVVSRRKLSLACLSGHSDAAGASALCCVLYFLCLCACACVCCTEQYFFAPN